MATTIGNAAKRLPESDVTDEPSMEEILTSIKQIIADDEQSESASKERDNFTYPENPSNSNKSDNQADDQQLDEALQAELNEVAIDDKNSSGSEQRAETSSTGRPLDTLENRVAAVRAELSSTSEALSPEERLQHYRSRNKLKTERSDEGKAAPSEASAISTDASAVHTVPQARAVTNRQVPAAVQQPVSMATTQFIASPPPETVAQELATIMLREKSGELETMLADLMRPTIRQWLNDNLPRMVQRLVREEIRAASRGHKAS